MERNKYTFLNMLKIFGVSKLILCKEAYLSLLIPTILFYSMFYITPYGLKEITLELSKLYIASDIALLAIVITALAILLSVSGSDFLFFLNRRNLNIRFFFPFYLSSVLWSCHAIFSVGVYLFASLNISNSFYNSSLIVITFIQLCLFFYALLNSISLVRTILRLSFEKAKLDVKIGNVNEILIKSTNDDQ